MSGLEVLGIAASILQIADIGVNVSIKLCTFYHQVKNVNESVQSLSSDVALTCNVLRQLGENLQQDEQAKLCSKQALATAKDVLDECKRVFHQISRAIEQPGQDDPMGRIRRAARKFGLALIERDLETFKCNLERLKSTMLLMLNVIMYAGQLRSRAESAVLQDQRALIQALVEQKKVYDQQFDKLNDAIISGKVGSSFHTSTSSPDPMFSGNAADLGAIPEEIRRYYALVQELLRQVDQCKSDLGERRHLRIRNGLVNVHSAELVRFELDYGRRSCQIFQDPFFQSKIEFEGDENLPPAVSRDANVRLSPSRGAVSTKRRGRTSAEYDHDTADLQARMQEHKRAMERKQQAYRESKIPPVYSETDFRREGIIDFDGPRLSTSEDTCPADDLVPQRQPPIAPSRSRTLHKVNSLRRKDEIKRVQPGLGSRNEDLQRQEHERLARMARFEELEKGTQEDQDEIDSVEAIVLSWTTLERENL
ncbi:hypothetical protein BDV59DRAFT_199158 [Aspergillus ambiguus]|uniref:uncharacterized protein n=1 Tax=Aspergillus ambiguus TaxID=176160 RepID=UPI003CCDA15D